MPRPGIGVGSPLVRLDDVIAIVKEHQASIEDTCSSRNGRWCAVFDKPEIPSEIRDNGEWQDARDDYQFAIGAIAGWNAALGTAPQEFIERIHRRRELAFKVMKDTKRGSVDELRIKLDAVTKQRDVLTQSIDAISVANKRIGKRQSAAEAHTEQEKKDWICEQFNRAWELWVNPAALYDALHQRSTHPLEYCTYLESDGKRKFLTDFVPQVIAAYEMNIQKHQDGKWSGAVYKAMEDALQRKRLVLAVFVARTS